MTSAGSRVILDLWFSVFMEDLWYIFISSVFCYIIFFLTSPIHQQPCYKGLHYVAVFPSVQPKFNSVFPSLFPTAAIFFLPLPQPVPPPGAECVQGRTGVGVGLLCSVETPISRTSRPPEGHSQSFGVRTEEGLVGQQQLSKSDGAELSAGPGKFSHDNHTFLAAAAVCIFSVFFFFIISFASHRVGKKKWLRIFC